VRRRRLSARGMQQARQTPPARGLVAIRGTRHHKHLLSK
jgi:hypothetical protein